MSSVVRRLNHICVKEHSGLNEFNVRRASVYCNNKLIYYAAMLAYATRLNIGVSKYRNLL